MTREPPSKQRVLVLGVLGWLPLMLVVGLAIYLTVLLNASFAGRLPVTGDPLANSEVRRFLVTLLAGSSAIAFLQIIVAGIFIADASGRVQGIDLALWALGFVFFGQFIMPAYWFKHLRGAPPPAARGYNRVGY
ncbi:MAG: hypothetical protein U0271_19485 [Polyangiaceae bacterium]